MIAAISSMRLLVVCRFASGKFFFRRAKTHDGAPAAGARIAAAGAIGENLDRVLFRCHIPMSVL